MLLNNYKLVLTSIFLLSSLCLFLLTVFIENSSVFSLFLRLKGAVEAIPLIFIGILLFVLSTKGRVKKYDALCIYLICFLVLAFVSIIVGGAIGSSLKYIISDTVRLAVSFSVLFYCVFSVSTLKSKEKFITDAIEALFILNIVMILYKVTLLFNGTFYGGGSNQYILSPFLFFLFYSSLVTKVNFVGITKKMAKIFLIVGIALTILSFKRQFWLILMLSLSFCLLFYSRRIRSFYFLLLFILLSAAFVYLNPGIIDLMMQRLEYTFSNNTSSGLDRSTYERVAEVKSALDTIGYDIQILEYIFGRGAGAEFSAAEGVSFIKDSTGSEVGLYHHIHNMYVILFFRYGIVGLMLFIVPVLYFVFKLLRFLKFNKVMIKNAKAYKYYILFIAATLELSLGLISGIASNSYYGSIFFSLWIIIAYYSLNISRFYLEHNEHTH